MPSSTESTYKTGLQEGKVLLLDGATGTELEKRGVNVVDSLWAGIAVLQCPDTLKEVYLDYLEAGADLIETNSYQLTTIGLREKKLDPVEVFQKSIDIASDAIKEYRQKTGSHREIGIVGSIGPYGAYLCDGSEFTGNYREVDDDKLIRFHRDRLAYMYNSPEVAMIAFETIPSFDEVKVLLDLVKEQAELAVGAGEKAKPFYIATSCSDEYMMVDGTSLHKLLGYINDHYDKNLIAVGSNCCKLRTSLVLAQKVGLELKNFPALKDTCKVVIYPNSGEVYDGYTKQWSVDSHLGYDDMDVAFTKAGELFVSIERMGIVGGCCRTGPEQIKALRKEIDDKHRTF